MGGWVAEELGPRGMLFLCFSVRIPLFPLHINIDGHGHAMLLTALFGEKRFSVVRANAAYDIFLTKIKIKRVPDENIKGQISTFQSFAHKTGSCKLGSNN